MNHKKKSSNKIHRKSILSKILNHKKIRDPHKKFIETSIYIVPPNTLLAYQYIPVQDQTVWIIDKYDKGYYFGRSYTAIIVQASSEKNLSGTITPFGDIYMTFLPIDGAPSNTDVVNGIGKFTIVDKNNGYFTMQMNSAQNNVNGLSHWSYMISVKPNDYFYHKLPGVNVSVPEFIKQF